MKKAVVFPYSNSCCELLRYKDMITDYEIVGAVALKGMGVDDRDTGFVDGGVDIGIKVETKVDYKKEFDAFIIIADMDNAHITNAMVPFIREGLLHNKDFVFLSAPHDNIISLFNNDERHMVNLCETQGDISFLRKLYKIETPVIVVAGTHELTHKFKIQLEINKYMKMQGYKVSHICSKPYGYIFGFHSFPEYMFNKEKEEDKIFYLNNYIRFIEKEEQPDVIILGIPGGVMPYNEQFPGYFGITFYEVMQAVKPDVLIMSCLYGKYTDQYFDDLTRAIHYKSGVDIDIFNISTFDVDLNESEQSKQLQYYKVSYRDVESNVSEYREHKIFNIMNGIDGKKIAEMAEKKLLEYADVEII